MKIVITSVGSLVGQNILDALEGRRDAITLVGTNSIAESANNFRCDTVYLAPPAIEKRAYRQRLLEVFERERPDIVLPGRDDDVLVLAELRDTMPQWSPIIPCGPLAAARILDDKLLSYQFARERGLPFADTASADKAQLADLVARSGFPLIAKPRAGNGSRGVCVIHNGAQLEAASALSGYLFQEYLDPAEDVLDLARVWATGSPLFHAPRYLQYACQILIAPSGELTAACCTQMTMIMGRCEQCVGADDADLQRVVEAYAKAFAQRGWVGPLNLQGRRNGRGEFKPYELNGRFTGATSARIHVGFDEVRLLVQQFTGRPLPYSPALGTPDRIVFKTLTDFSIGLPDLARLRNQGVWTAPTHNGMG
jgi:carbamoyl-phosphate synthase large subunit